MALFSKHCSIQSIYMALFSIHCSIYRVSIWHCSLYIAVYRVSIWHCSLYIVVYRVSIWHCSLYIAVYRVSICMYHEFVSLLLKHCVYDLTKWEIREGQLKAPFTRYLRMDSSSLKIYSMYLLFFFYHRQFLKEPPHFLFPTLTVTVSGVSHQNGRNIRGGGMFCKEVEEFRRTLH